MVTWIRGYVDTWTHVYVDTWIRGYVDTWIRVYIVFFNAFFLSRDDDNPRRVN